MIREFRSGGELKRLKSHLIWLLLSIFTVCFGFESFAS